MYSQILVPLDSSNFSEQILPYAWFFADVFKIPVVLLHVADPAARPPFWPEATGEAYLKEVAEKHFASSVGVTINSAVGTPEEVILDSARSDPSCLIAMATRGVSGMRRWLIGSVASKVARAAANPVLLIRPGEVADRPTPVKLNTVFVPLDGSGLAEKALPHARALAKAAPVEIHLVRAYQLPAEAHMVADGVIAQGAAQYREELRREAQAYLDGKVAGLCAEGLERVSATVVEGDAAGEIIDFARRTPNNLVIMSSHGRSGIRRWVLGSVAEKVVQYSQDPVLLVRAA